MKILLILSCLMAVVFGAEIIYTPGNAYSYYAPGVPVYSRSSAVVPLTYARVHAPVSAVETYNSVQTPDSFQQQYRNDYKPLTYGYAV